MVMASAYVALLRWQDCIH